MFTEASRGFVDDALKGSIISGVKNESQIGDGIFYWWGLQKIPPSCHIEGYASPD